MNNSTTTTKRNLRARLCAAVQHPKVSRLDAIIDPYLPPAGRN
jgi:hypothetical protein